MKKHYAVLLSLIGVILVAGIYIFVEVEEPAEVSKKSNVKKEKNTSNSSEQIDVQGLKEAKEDLDQVVVNIKKRGVNDQEVIARILKEELEYSLSQIVMTGNKEMTKAYLERGGNVNQLDSHNRTALHAAVKTGSSEMVEFLLQNGAKVDGGDANDWTPLMEASYYGYDGIIRKLIRSGASVSDVVGQTEGWKGWFPLAIATRTNDPKTVAVLLEHGADPEKTIQSGEWEGWSPKEIAEEYQYSAISDLFDKQT